MNIAVVGDVHGHLPLMYAVLGRWQRETGRRISLILQVGDLGTFLPTSQVDSATRKYAERDPDELGFGEFAGTDPPQTLLDPRPPLVFIPGNHEDFGFLAECAARVPVDEPLYPVSADGKIRALRSGRIWTFVEGDERVRIGGASGAANLRRKHGRHERCHLQEDEALQLAGAGRGAFDILIAHDRPDRLWGGSHHGPDGSPALRLVVDAVGPCFAFFGHYNRSGEWAIGSTRVIGLSDCGYDHKRDWHIDEDGVGVIEWTGAEPGFERVAPEWLKSSTRYDWRHWGTP